MEYAYIGEVHRYLVKGIIERHPSVVVTGDYGKGEYDLVELGVPSNFPEKAIDLFINMLDKGRL